MGFRDVSDHLTIGEQYDDRDSEEARQDIVIDDFFYCISSLCLAKPSLGRFLNVVWGIHVSYKFCRSKRLYKKRMRIVTLSRCHYDPPCWHIALQAARMSASAKCGCNTPTNAWGEKRQRCVDHRFQGRLNRVTEWNFHRSAKG